MFCCSSKPCIMYQASGFDEKPTRLDEPIESCNIPACHSSVVSLFSPGGRESLTVQIYGGWQFDRESLLFFSLLLLADQYVCVDASIIIYWPRRYLNCVLKGKTNNPTALIRHFRSNFPDFFSRTDFLYGNNRSA